MPKTSHSQRLPKPNTTPIIWRTYYANIRRYINEQLQYSKILFYSLYPQNYNMASMMWHLEMCLMLKCYEHQYGPWISKWQNNICKSVTVQPNVTVGWFHGWSVAVWLTHTNTHTQSLWGSTAYLADAECPNLEKCRLSLTHCPKPDSGTS